MGQVGGFLSSGMKPKGKVSYNTHLLTSVFIFWVVLSSFVFLLALSRYLILSTQAVVLTQWGKKKINKLNRYVSTILALCRKAGITGKCVVISLSRHCLFCQTPNKAAPLSVERATAPMKYPGITFTSTTGA